MRPGKETLPARTTETQPIEINREVLVEVGRGKTGHEDLRQDLPYVIPKGPGDERST